jgi:chromosome segregation ATPase
MKSADAAGRSYAYVEQIRRVDGAFAFFSAEKDEITKKVGGAAQYVVKKKGCDVEVSGTVGASLKEAVDKQLEKEIRDVNAGQQLVERYRVSLGKDNAAALEKQVDAVSRMSYLAHIEIVEEKLRVQRMVAEAEDVRRTGDEFTRAEKEFQAEKKTTDAEKKASEERIAEMNKSRANLDAAIKQGQDLLPKLEEQSQAIQKEYDDAFAALLSKIDDHAKSDPK